MAVPKITYMPLDQLVTTAAFRRLAPRPAHWVRLYIQEFIDTGIFDHNAVTKVVYPSPLAVRIRSTAHRLRHDLKVAAVVKCFLDSADGNLAADLAEVQHHLDACEPGSVAAQRLLSLKNGLKRGRYVEDDEPAAETAPAPEAAQAPGMGSPSDVQIFPRRVAVGDIVTVDGVRHRVTVVDADGNATEGDPIE